ncbi:MAG: DUF2071 domain-containing protein [Salinibacter sp.]
MMSSSPSSSSRPRILRATARNRVVVSYAVAPDRVAPHLPDGLVPMTQDGRAYVSLVGVELTKVRVLGLVGPGFRRVPAVELRVHVQPTQGDADAVGTWTVRAHVSRHLVAWGARLLYREPVAVASMQPIRREPREHLEVTYRFDWKGREQRLRVRGERTPVMPAPDTLAPPLLRPNWRYTTRTGTLLRTRIDRPATPIHRVQEHHVTVRWPDVYGEIGHLLADRDPALVLLSPGTPVTLRWREQV